MSVVNWAKLVRQDRAKAYGTPWSDEELEAIYKRGMDPDDVREGFLTETDRVRGTTEEEEDRELLESALEKKITTHLTNDELAREAKFRGILVKEGFKRGNLLKKLSKARKEDKEVEKAKRKKEREEINKEDKEE